MIKKIKDYIFGVKQGEVKEKKLEPKGLTLEIYVVTLQDSSKLADSPYEVKNADYSYLIEAKRQIDEEITGRDKDAIEKNNAAYAERRRMQLRYSSNFDPARYKEKEPSDENVQLEGKDKTLEEVKHFLHSEGYNNVATLGEVPDAHIDELYKKYKVKYNIISDEWKKRKDGKKVAIGDTRLTLSYGESVQLAHLQRAKESKKAALGEGDADALIEADLAINRAVLSLHELNRMNSAQMPVTQAQPSPARRKSAAMAKPAAKANQKSSPTKKRRARGNKK